MYREREGKKERLMEAPDMQRDADARWEEMQMDRGRLSERKREGGRARGKKRSR